MIKYSLLKQEKPVVSENHPIYIFSDGELTNMKISELKHMGLKAIQFYSDVLKDYFYFAINESTIPELVKEGIPIYTETEIKLMLDAPDDQTRRALHKFKKTFLGSGIHKANTNKGT